MLVSSFLEIFQLPYLLHISNACINTLYLLHESIYYNCYINLIHTSNQYLCRFHVEVYLLHISIYCTCYINLILHASIHYTHSMYQSIIPITWIDKKNQKCMTSSSSSLLPSGLIGTASFTWKNNSHLVYWLFEETCFVKVVSSNPSTVFWMDIFYINLL